MITISKYTLLCAAFFGVLFSSCEQEQPFQNPNTEITRILTEPTPVISIVQSPIPECTLVSADWAETSIALLQSKTFEIQYIEGAIYKWTVSGGLTIVGADNTNKVTVKGTVRGSGTLSVTMDVPGNAPLACGNTGTILIRPTGGGDDTPCACPEPKIVPDLCVSGGHPHWRLHVINTSSSDKIRWYTQHATIMGSNNTKNVVAKVLENAAGGFTIYCEVTRPCAGGTSKYKTAFYRNSYGGSCSGGTTGFSNTCTGGTPPGDDLK